MEDFYFAGGLKSLMKQMEKNLNLDTLTVNGKTLGENLEGAEVFNEDVIRALENPVSSTGGTAILRRLSLIHI